MHIDLGAKENLTAIQPDGGFFSLRLGEFGSYSQPELDRTVILSNRYRTQGVRNLEGVCGSGGGLTQGTVADEPGEVGCVCGAGTLFRLARSNHSLDLYGLISRTAEYGPRTLRGVGGGVLRGVLPIPIMHLLRQNTLFAQIQNQKLSCQCESATHLFPTGQTAVFLRQNL